MVENNFESRKARRSSSRKQRRAAQRKRNRLIALFASLVILIPAFGAGFYFATRPVSALDAAKMFPSNTTELKTFTPANISTTPSADVLKTLTSYAENQQGQKDNSTPTSEYTDEFFNQITSFSKLKSSQDWLGVSFADGKWENGQATLYALTNSNKAKDYMTSEACKESFLKEYCGEGNYLIKNNWLVTGSHDSLNLYKEDLKRTLADNTEFATQTADTITNSFAAAWTPSENITDFLPLGLAGSFPSKAKASVALVPTTNGIAVRGSIFKGESENPMFSKEPIADSITKLPKNTVMAISSSQTYQDVENMTKNPESFINKDPSWTGLRKGLEEFGVAVPTDLKDILGETTTLSLNEGTVGNKVAGTLRIHKGKPEKALDVLSRAAQKNKEITEMYVAKQGSDDFLIESHSPITEGNITENPLFGKLVGPMDKSIAVAFIDFDSTRGLLNSEYVKPESSYDKGVMGINLFNRDAKTIGFTVNWDMVKTQAK